MDVIVVGAGPSGMIAAREAQERGATVVVMEMAAEPGGGGPYAGRFFGVGTQMQADHGVEDSVEIALAEWSEFTHAEPDEVVESFLEDSAAVLLDFAERYEVRFGGPAPDIDAGTTARVYERADAYVDHLSPELEDLRLETRVDELLVGPDGVCGVVATDAGGSYELTAHAVIVATGGFARDVERVRADRPLLGEDTVVEMHPDALGLGHDLVEEVGAGWQNPGRYGTYVHSLVDPEDPDEALWLFGIPPAMGLNAQGHRIIDESASNTFDLSYILETAEEPRWVLFFNAETSGFIEAARPVYNDPGEERLDLEDLLATGSVLAHEDIWAAGEAVGIDVTEAAATYDAYAEAGEDPDYGKKAAFMSPFGDDPVVTAEIVPGFAKAFGGIPTDADGRIVDDDGEVIPGLYGSGELIGVLGTPAIGRGFTGSITAVYWSGLRTGRTAAEDALSE